MPGTIRSDSRRTTALTRLGRLDTTWMADAACAGTGSEAFYAGDGNCAPAAIRRLCRGCPVRSECLDYALATPAGDDWGVWAGTTRRQRAELRQRIEAAA